MKRTMCIILSFVLVCLLAACGGEKVQQPEITPAAEENAPEPEITPAAEENAPEFELDTKIDVARLDHPYGFQENRAWVRNQSGQYLIAPSGEVVLAIPKDPDAAYSWNTFSRIWNGAGYIEGENVESGWPAVLFIDADGNELSRFESSETERYAVIGRSEKHFLVRCLKQTTDTQLDVYLLSLNLDGTLSGAPRLVLSVESGLSSMESYEIEAEYMGEEIFHVGLHSLLDGHGFYNCANNTFQYTPVREYYFGGKFFNGSTVVNSGETYPTSCFFASPEDFQGENANLVLTRGAVLGDKSSRTGSVMQYGPWLVDAYSRIFDQQGNELALPELQAGKAVKQGYLDGYLLIEQSRSFGVLGPDGELLYPLIKEEDYHPVFLSYTDPVNSCGYILAKNNEMNQYGVIDREGKFHSFSEDLSTLPDFDQLNMEGLGDGYILATEEELGLERQTGGYVIRSLDGGQTVGGLSKTSATKVLQVSAPVLRLDPASAQPVGIAAASEEAHTVTTSSEVQNMGADGVIYAERFENVLLFEKDGVTITMTAPGVIEFANDNPDNQKAFLSPSAAQLNGIQLNYTILDSEELAVGERVEFTWDYDSRGFSPSFSETIVEYASSLSQMPLQELRLQFSLSIGSESESVAYTRTVRLTSYSEESLKALRGDAIGEYSLIDGGEPAIRIYRLQDGNYFAYAIENISDERVHTLFGDISFHWLVNGENLPSSIHSIDSRMDLAPGAIQLIQLQANAQDLRRECEIPNSEPVELTLVLHTTVGTIQMPVEQIK